MHPKIKLRPAGEKIPVGRVKPLLLHEVPNPAASGAGARRPLRPKPSAAAAANHSRHHVSRQTQA